VTIPVSGKGVLGDQRAGGERACCAHLLNRWRYPYRLHDGAVQVLDPPRKTATAGVVSSSDGTL
jgi:hypothetical protein